MWGLNVIIYANHMAHIKSLGLEKVQENEAEVRTRNKSFSFRGLKPIVRA